MTVAAFFVAWVALCVASLALFVGLAACRHAHAARHLAARAQRINAEQDIELENLTAIVCLDRAIAPHDAPSRN